MIAEVGGWQLEVSVGWESGAEDSTGRNQRPEYEVGARWSSPCEDMRLVKSNVIETGSL
jgi:hypothetical protein